MYKGIYESTNKGLGFKLINFMSFGESVISVDYSKKPSWGIYSSNEIKKLFRGIYMGKF
jgi:hypothetical protein